MKVRSWHQLGDSSDPQVFGGAAIHSEYIRGMVDHTAFVLLKFGFVFNTFSLIYELGEFSIEDWGDGEFIFKWNSFNIQIDLKYAHQLQNLYFALTGKELTIKP